MAAVALAVNEILISSNAVSSIIREGATQKLQDVIVSGKGEGTQFMDDAIWALLQQGAVSPHEAFMKAIDKNLFKKNWSRWINKASPIPPVPPPTMSNGRREISSRDVGRKVRILSRGPLRVSEAKALTRLGSKASPILSFSSRVA